jgi:hypothetical protein
MFAFLSSVEPVEPVILANSNHPVKEPAKYMEVVEFALLVVFEVLGTGLQAAGQSGVQPNLEGAQRRHTPAG